MVEYWLTLLARQWVGVGNIGHRISSTRATHGNLALDLEPNLLR
jgi:hypothetical protein